ncbi:Uncharacterised protein [uncultured archaeon]|nr:Uncharacterised protein [uncultured archaeon]
MADEITDLNKDIEEHVKGLEARKAELLERISKLNGRLRYKQYEKKALEPFLEQTKDVRVGPIRKNLRELEFRISTQAYTPKIEKDLVKQVKKLEAELGKVSEVEKARRKKMLVDGDIEQVLKEIASIEPELKKIRDELNDHYESMRSERKQAKKGIKSDHMVTLEDVAVFEKEE